MAVEVHLGAYSREICRRVLHLKQYLVFNDCAPHRMPVLVCRGAVGCYYLQLGFHCPPEKWNSYGVGV